MTIQAQNYLKSTITNHTHNEKTYFVCFIDFEKAFDKVGRNLLLQKLMRLVLHGKILSAITSVLTNKLKSVLNGTHLSNGVEQKMGVAQGNKLSPLLLSLFFAVMKYLLQDIDCDITFYADDMTIGTTSPDALQKSLSDLAEHCNNNGLTFHIVKTKIIKSRGGGRLAKHDHFHYLEEEIEIVNKFCYLAVVLSTQLSARPHQENPYKRALTTIASIKLKLYLQKINF